jgi:hypothetical protein
MVTHHLSNALLARRLAVFLVWLALLTTSMTSFGGIIIDGVPDSNYTTYAAQFAASGRLLGGSGPASGTLIAPNWVLSVGHALNATTFQPGGVGTIYNVDQVIYHPTFVANGFNLRYGYDIALYRLSTPVVGVTPANIYRGSLEVGETASLTGFGVTGVGVNPSPGGAIVHRAGTNDLDAVIDLSNGPMGQVGAQDSVLIFDFDAPNGQGAPGQYNTLLSPFASSAAPTTLEYHLAGGDSGGGVYIEDGGQFFLAGLNSAVENQQSFYNSLGLMLPGNTNNFGYGAIGYLTRVSSFQTFIDSNISPIPEPNSGLIVAFSLSVFSFRRSRRNCIAG